ncbi:MAG: hypothetical protein ACI4FZ_08960 [Lachnospiraceae bacterium]
MSDKLEQIMKKIHIYLANCKESAYSSEDVIVSKKRMLGLLEELNYAVYEVMEEYEATTAARERGQAAAERMATDIKEDAMKRAEEIYASSLLYTQDAISNMQNALEYTYQKTKTEYESLLTDYEDKMHYLQENSQDITSQLESMADSKIYLHLIEEIKAKNERRSKEDAANQQASYSKKLGSVTASEVMETEQDEYASKLSSPIVVEVHSSPKIPDGFGKGRGKKKGKKIVNEASMQSQDLDAEYFAFQEEQERALAEQLKESAAAAEEETKESETEETTAPTFFKDAFKKFSGKKK